MADDGGEAADTDEVVKIVRAEDPTDEASTKVGALRLGCSLAACRALAAQLWGWPASCVLLRRPDGTLLKDGSTILEEPIELTATLRCISLEVKVNFAASPLAPSLQNDAQVVVKVEIPEKGPITAFDVREAIGQKLGIHYSGLVLHGLPDDLPPVAGADADVEDATDDGKEDAEGKNVKGPDDGGEEEEKEEAELDLAALDSNKDHDFMDDVTTIKAAPTPKGARGLATLEEDEGFEPVLRLRRAHFEAKQHLEKAKEEAADAEAQRAATEALLPLVQRWYARERAEDARLEADKASVLKADAEEMAERAQQAADDAATKVPITVSGSEEAKAIVEEKAQLHTQAKEVAREAAKACQQARITRKKVAQAIQAQKEADEDRDAKQQEMYRLRKSEEQARPLVKETEEIAKKAAAAAAEAAATSRATEALAAQVHEFASLAQEAAGLRAEGWIGENAEFKRQGYKPPVLGDSMRDVDVLQELNPPLRRILCRLRPRAARVFSEMSAANELFGIMGIVEAGPAAKALEKPWSGGWAKTLELLNSRVCTENGDLILQAEHPLIWRVALVGPRGSPYEGYFHWIKLEFPDLWPAAPPLLSFETSIYHCNVTKDGKIHFPPLTTLQQRWSGSGDSDGRLKASDTAFPLLGSLLELLCAPQPEAPAPGRADLVELLNRDADAYNRAATSHCREHAVAFATLLPNGPPNWYRKGGG